MSDKCQQIEDYLKSMIFKNTDTSTDTASRSQAPGTSQHYLQPIILTSVPQSIPHNQLWNSEGGSVGMVPAFHNMNTMNQGPKPENHVERLVPVLPQNPMPPRDVATESRDAASSEKLPDASQTVRKKKIESERRKLKKRQNRRAKNALRATEETNSSQSSSSAPVDVQPGPSEKVPEVEVKRILTNQTDHGTQPPKTAMDYLQKKGKWKFKCDVCDYLTNAENIMNDHIATPMHKQKDEEARQDRLLYVLPKPLPAQIRNVDEAVKDVVEKIALTHEEIKQRLAVADRIHQLVSSEHTGCSIDVVGSTKTEVGLNKSEVDLTLKVPPSTNAADILEQVHMLLSQKDRQCKNVYKEFLEKIPRIQFKDNKTRALFNITMENSHSVQLTKLISCYMCLDSRAPILAKACRAWANLCGIDNPDNGTLPTFSYVLLVIYFLQRVQPPVLPVLKENPETLAGKSVETLIANYGSSKNQSPIGLLWIQFLQFYSCQYEAGHEIVSIRTSEKLTCKEKNWGTKFIAIEDPIWHRNLAHVIPNQRVFQYIQNCFKNTYRYFGYPQTKDGPLTVIRRNGGASKSLTTPDDKEDGRLLLERLLEDHDPSLAISDVIATMSKMALDDIKSREQKRSSVSSSTSNGTQDNVSNPAEINKTSSSSEGSPKSGKSDIEPSQPNDDGAVIYEWSSKDVVVSNYSFPSVIFKGGRTLPLVCRSCQKTGHSKNDCPDEKLPPVLPLPEMTSEFMNCINEVCQQIQRENMPSHHELKQRDQDRLELQKYIRTIYPKADLQLFGSFRNGFGFSKSDMDLCLTFSDDNGKHLDQVPIIEILATLLGSCPRFINVIAITSAKVPIVKFFDRNSQLEGDISLYNTLAQYNTRMLETYCSIDERVQTLGYVFKYFAKTLGICDASKGSLSSYAYILMVIFFLQQREPPVIPVLQELCENKTPVVEVDGWNTWYFSDISRLSKVWPEYGKNKETVGELWLGLLKFYASEFSLEEYVVSIKQKERLSCFKKFKSCSKKITIEDPFDLNHNLGSGLSGKMNNYIVKVFIRGREHFGTPQSMKYMMTIHRNGPKGFLFDRRQLNKGREPPKDRGCRRCGKIGHILKDCPSNQEKRESKSSEGSPGKSSSPHKRDKGFRRGSQESQASIIQPVIPSALQNSILLQHQMPPGFSLNTRPPLLFNHPQDAKLDFVTRNMLFNKQLRGQRPTTLLPFPTNQPVKPPAPYHGMLPRGCRNPMENGFPNNSYRMLVPPQPPPQLQQCFNRPLNPQMMMRGPAATLSGPPAETANIQFFSPLNASHKPS